MPIGLFIFEKLCPKTLEKIHIRVTLSQSHLYVDILQKRAVGDGCLGLSSKRGPFTSLFDSKGQQGMENQGAGRDGNRWRCAFYPRVLPHITNVTLLVFLKNFCSFMTLAPGRQNGGGWNISHPKAAPFRLRVQRSIRKGGSWCLGHCLHLPWWGSFSPRTRWLFAPDNCVWAAGVGDSCPARRSSSIFSLQLCSSPTPALSFILQVYWNICNSLSLEPLFIFF